MTLTLIAVFGVFQAILFLMHTVIYRMIADSFGWQWPWLKWLFVALSIAFVSAALLAHRFNNALVRWYYRLGTYWFGLSIFLFMGALGAYFLEYFSYTFGYYISPAIVSGVCLGSVFLVHTYASIRTRHIRVTRVSVGIKQGGSAWPESWQGKKIVFVSDVHLGAVLSKGFAQNVVDAISAESPDMVLIGGDIFDGVKCHSQSLLRPFKDLHPQHGIFFATGNHEYIEDTPILLNEIGVIGIRTLRDQVVDIGGIQLAGVDWKDTYKKEDFEKFLTDMHIDPNKPSILLRHEPSHLEVAEQAGISLTLSGHTHAGQIWPIGYITSWIYKGFDYHLKQLGKMMVYTSSGVGTWGPPLRFGTRSEIVVITLK